MPGSSGKVKNRTGRSTRQCTGRLHSKPAQGDIQDALQYEETYSKVRDGRCIGANEFVRRQAGFDRIEHSGNVRLCCLDLIRRKTNVWAHHGGKQTQSNLAGVLVVPIEILLDLAADSSILGVQCPAVLLSEVCPYKNTCKSTKDKEPQKSFT